MEPSSDLFYQAATLMLVGMGFVFAFLSLLIFAIKVFITPLAKRYPDAVATNSNERRLSTKIVSSDGDGAISPSIVAAITAAVTQHRKNKQQK